MILFWPVFSVRQADNDRSRVGKEMVQMIYNTDGKGNRFIGSDLCNIINSLMILTHFQPKLVLRTDRQRDQRT